MQRDLFDGKIDIVKLHQSMQSWFAHLDHGDTWKLKQALLKQLDWLNYPSQP
jgi:hypothetical protein